MCFGRPHILLGVAGAGHGGGVAPGALRVRQALRLPRVRAVAGVRRGGHDTQGDCFEEHPDEARKEAFQVLGKPLKAI